MNRVRVSLVVGLLSSVSSLKCWAQSQADAFATSYAAEAKANYPDAIGALQAVYTGTYEQNVRLGWLFFLAKNYSSSTAHYQKAVEQRPAALEAKFGLVKPLNAMGQMDKVLQLYTDILHINPQNTQANYWTGIIYFNRKAYAQAASHFERVVSLYPFDYDANFSLAAAYHSLGRKAEARSLYGKVLLIRPADAAATEALNHL
ncbi:tetratricopeptide repeat protein [Hymenobacter convexus]|uniref:tetratricopeptide repeat protein n=1 Tax=Hymenobacter sp. CA1UV-4 TaxID=3063782 RepID=UPI0027132093|nr:tetratricopeptide repeat protein [Hymenobacter sp. CA1UV-4]MDO7854070.1 tetratricopeptide repeat protein [Hymenobacter sp. CA1UV-4]